MKTPTQYSFIFFLSATIVFGSVYFGLCFAVEFKKLKKIDLLIDGNLCYLPRSSAFGLGFGALICLCIAQIIGNVYVFRNSRSRNQNRGGKVRKPTVPCSLIVFSWVSFGVAVVLISVATSMSRSQAFGKGWLDGECYLVKDGVYMGSAFLGLLALSSTLGSEAIMTMQMLPEEYKKGSCTI